MSVVSTWGTQQRAKIEQNKPLSKSDEGLKLETSVFESFTVANLPIDLVVDNLL